MKMPWNTGPENTDREKPRKSQGTSDIFCSENIWIPEHCQYTVRLMKGELCGMIAKEYLSGAWYIERQVQSKLEQIEALKSLACRVTAGMGNEPVSRTRNVTSMQDTIVRILEAEDELNRRIDELVGMKLEIMRVIDRVQDITQRLILEKRYLSFRSWEQIAVDMCYTVRWTLMRHEEALAAVQEILDNGDISC